MAKNSQKSLNRGWTKVPKKTTTTSTKLGSSTLKLADSRRSCRRNSSSQKKNGKGPAKKLFTRDTKQVHVRPDVVKFVFRAEKRSQFKKAEKPSAALVVRKNKCLTLDVLQEFRKEIKKNVSIKKKKATTKPPTTKSGMKKVVKKNRLSHKVCRLVPSILTCRLKLVENKEQTYFFLTLGGHFLTKNKGQEACEAAFAILKNEIETATKKADDANKRDATHIERRQIAKDRRAPRRKHSDHRKVSKSVTSTATTFSFDNEDFPTMNGEYPTDAKGDLTDVLDSTNDNDNVDDVLEYPKPDELFVNILECMSERVQLEKPVIVNNSDILITKESLRIAELEEQLNIMQAFIHQMTVSKKMIQ